MRQVTESRAQRFAHAYRQIRAAHVLKEMSVWRFIDLCKALGDDTPPNNADLDRHWNLISQHSVFINNLVNKTAKSKKTSKTTHKLGAL